MCRDVKDAHSCRSYYSESSFRSSKDLVWLKLVLRDYGIKAIATGILAHLRISFSYRTCKRLQQLVQSFHPVVKPIGACKTDAAVRINNIHLFQKVYGISVSEAVDATGVVGYHASDCAVVTTCRVWWEKFVFLSQFLVKYRLDYSGLYCNVIVFNFHYSIHMPCKINDNAAL